MNPPKEVLRAVAVLGNMPEMRDFREWLRGAALREMNTAIRATEHADVMRGRAQMIVELQGLFETAQAQIQRLEKINGKTKQGQSRDPRRGQTGRAQI